MKPASRYCQPECDSMDGASQKVLFKGGLLTKTNDELGNLHPRHPLLPPDADAASALEVVPVHYDVHGEVQHYHYPRYGGPADKLDNAKDGSGTMMIAVQERYGFRMSICRLRISNAGEWFAVFWGVGSPKKKKERKCSLKGFFFKKRKTVSRSSRYLVK